MLKVDHLYKSYQTGRAKYEVLKDVSFEVKEGEFVAVMGAVRLRQGQRFSIVFPVLSHTTREPYH